MKKNMGQGSKKKKKRKRIINAEKKAHAPTKEKKCRATASKNMFQKIYIQ